MAQLGHEVEYLLAAAGGALVRRMSGEAADRLAVRLGTLVHDRWRSRRKVAYENIRKAFGEELPEALIRDLTRRVFQNMARSLVEMSRLEALGREGVRRIVQGDDFRTIDEARARGRGCIVATAHFGSWEMFGVMPSLLGHPSQTLVGVQHNPKTHALLNRYRSVFGARMIEATVAARSILRALQQNQVVGIAADQHSHTGMPLDFFGRTAVASRGPAIFAVKAGAPLLPFLMRRERYDCHLVMAGEPIYPPGSGNHDRDVDDMTVALHRFFESVIRRYPDQWMWTHRRWKAADASENSSNL